MYEFKKPSKRLTLQTLEETRNWLAERAGLAAALCEGKGGARSARRYMQ